MGDKDIGKDVLVLMGFTHNNFLIARDGVPIFTRKGNLAFNGSSSPAGGKRMIVSCGVHKGASGSPVFLHEEQGGGLGSSVSRELRLIGIATKSIEVLYSKSGLVDSGYAGVVSVDALVELLAKEDRGRKEVDLGRVIGVGEREVVGDHGFGGW